MLLTFISSTILFGFMIQSGNLLMFVTPISYYLIPIFAIYLLMLSFIYKTPSCKPLEKRDFIFTLLFTGLSWIIYKIMDVHFDLDVFSYLYLSTFIALLSFTCSLRYKSLI